jgi:excisionase family DNA binding protein
MPINADHLKKRWIGMARQIPNIPTQEKITLRISETVAVSGLSRSTIYELLKAGKLRAVKVGRRRLILRDSLQTLLQAAEG